MNWYVYCSNNPLIYVDPSGLDDHYQTVEDLLPEGSLRRTPGRALISVKAIVIHWTNASNQSEKGTRDYWANNVGRGSTQYAIGQKGGRIRAVPDWQEANGAGGYENVAQAIANNEPGAFIYTPLAKVLFPKWNEPNFRTQPNLYTIGIEINAISNVTKVYTYDAIESAVQLTAKLLFENHMVKGRTQAERMKEIVNGYLILRHSDIVNKPCPQGVLATAEGWRAFKERVAWEYEDFLNDSLMAIRGLIPIYQYTGAKVEKKYIPDSSQFTANTNNQNNISATAATGQENTPQNSNNVVPDNEQQPDSNSGALDLRR